MVKIVFYTNNGIISNIIKWFTKSKVNHVAIVYNSLDWDTEITIESSFNGVICHKSSRKTSYEFEINNSNAFEYLKSITNHLGEFYDYIGLVWFGILLLYWKIFKTKIKKPLYTTKGQFCSELVARYFNCLPNIKIKSPQWTSPEDLLNICKNNPDLFVRVR